MRENLTILHFAPDDKFIPLMQGFYAEAFAVNKWRIIPGKRQSYKFVKPHAMVKSMGADYFESKAMLADLATADVVVFHFLWINYKRVIAAAKATTLLVWHSWGGDYASRIEPFTAPICLEKTRSLLLAVNVTKLFDRNPFGVLKRKLSRPKKMPPFSDKDWARIDVISIQKEIFPALQKAIPALKAKVHYLSSYSLEDTFQKGAATFEGKDILLGNSATPSNNHLEALLLLRKLELKGRRVVLPLNYGDTNYAKVIQFIGKRLVKQLDCLLEYLPVATYHDKIQSCGVVIMNHTRQQARGNITTALYKGAKVFLRAENPIYQQYRALGLHIFPVQDLKQADARSLTPLTVRQKKENKSIIEQNWNRAQALLAVKELAIFAKAKKMETLNN